MVKIYRGDYIMNEYLKHIYQKTKENFYQELNNNLKNKTKKFIITANPETLISCEKDKELEKIILNKTNIIVPDGISIVKACNKIGINIKDRITGIEICEYLLKLANEKGYSLYLFGAKKEVLEKLVKKIKEKYSGIDLLGYQNGYGKDKGKVMEEIIVKKPDICLVALGIPAQEKLIAKYINKAKKGIFIGVGGSFDVLSGTKKRAPKIMIKLNLEWLYRIIKEPKRIKRFWNNNIKFLFKVKKN